MSGKEQVPVDKLIMCDSHLKSMTNMTWLSNAKFNKYFAFNHIELLRSLLF